MVQFEDNIRHVAILPHLQGDDKYYKTKYVKIAIIFKTT